MAKELLTWDEIAQKDEFKALDKAEREKLRNTYFSRAIASRTPTEQLDDARKRFDKDTKPTILKSIKGAVGDVVEKLTPEPNDEQPIAPAPAGTRATAQPRPQPQSPPASTTPSIVQRGLGWAADTGKDAYDMAAMSVGGAIPKIPAATEQVGRGMLRQGMMAAPAMMAAAGGMGHPAAAQAQLDAQRATTPQAVDETMTALPKIQTFEDWSAYGDQVRKDIETQLSPKLKKALDDSKVSGNLFKGEIDFGKDPSVYGYSMQAVSVLGSMVPTLATLFVTRSPAAAASVGGGMAASEGMDAAREFIKQKSDAELYQESPGFKVLVDKGMPVEQARAIITDKATEASATLQGMVGALGDVATSKLLMGHFDNVISGLAKGKAGRIGVGAAGAGVEGAVTEVAEGVGSDVGIAGQVPTKEIGEDSAENAVLGALGGAAIGAAGGAMAGSPKDVLAQDMLRQSEQGAPMDPAAADLAARQAMDPNLASGAVAPPGGIPPGAMPARPQIVPERGPISRAANSGAAAAAAGINPMAIEEDDDGTGLAGPKKRPIGIQGIEIPKPMDPGKGPAVRPKIPQAPPQAPKTGGIPGDISQTLNRYSSQAGAKFRTGLDEGAFADLAHRVMWQESRGKTGAVSPKGAKGLMQLMPGTAANPGFGIEGTRDNSPEENMRVGTEYLAAMLNRYDGDVSLALIAYNAGPGTADDVRSGKRQTLPKETQGYLKTIMGGKPPPKAATSAAPTTQETDARTPQARVETPPAQPDGGAVATTTAPVDAQADAVPEPAAQAESYPDVEGLDPAVVRGFVEAYRDSATRHPEPQAYLRGRLGKEVAAAVPPESVKRLLEIVKGEEPAPVPAAPPAASGIKATPATTPAETTPLGLPSVLKPESAAPAKTPKPKTTMAPGVEKAGTAAGTLKSGQEPREMRPDGWSKDGKPILPGNTFKTSSGRVTTPYPKQKGVKHSSQWLIENAAAEAEARGDDFNAPVFKATTLLKGGELATSDRESMQEYLFGEQPPVVDSILKDPTTGRPMNRPAQEKAPEQAPQPARYPTTNEYAAQMEADLRAEGRLEPGEKFSLRDVDMHAYGQGFKDRDAWYRSRTQQPSDASATTPPVAGQPAGAVGGGAADGGGAGAAPQSTDAGGTRASWVIKNKATGEVVMETFDRKKVDALNAEKYEAVPIAEHLNSLNTKPGAQPVEPVAKKPKPRPKLTVEPEKDDILAAIAKLGGVSSSEAKQQGIDPAHFGKRGHLIHRVFSKGGMSFDGMAETLNQYGYPVTDEDGNYTENALLDALSAALDGKKRQISTQGAEVEGERLFEDYLANLEAQQSDDWTALDQMDLEDPVSFDAERATNLRLAGIHVMGEDAFDDMAERLAVRFADDDVGYLNALEEAVDDAKNQSAAQASERATGNRQEEPSGFTLAGESQADLDAKREADERKAREDAARLKRDEDKRRADAAVDGFDLSAVETNPEAQKAADLGQQGMDFGAFLEEATQPATTLDAILPPEPGEPLDKDALFDALMDEEFAEAAPKPKRTRKPATLAPKPKPERTAGESAESAARNTADAFSEAASGLLKLFDPGKGTLGSGPVFTEETYAEAKPHFIAMAAHLKDAAADTADLMRAIIRALRDQFGMSRDGVANMKPYVIRFAEDVESGTINLEGTDVQPTAEDSRGDRGVGEGLSDQGAADAPGAGTTGGAGQDGPATAGAGRDGQRRDGVPGSGPAVVGGRGGARVPSKNGKLGDRASTAGAGERAGGDGAGADGLSPDAAGATPTSQAAVGSSKRVDLAAAAKVAVKPADPENIAASLPQLLEGQQADVLFAEKRFAAGGRGVLFTNGTGTGKTFTGLGIVARQVRQGRKNIIITVPGENVAASWTKAAKDHFGLDIHRLADTKDAGPEGSVVITTYANFGANQNLVERQWDMIVHDEAHYLSSSQNGDPTAVLRMSRALTGHPNGAYGYAEMMEPQLSADVRALRERATAALRMASTGNEAEFTAINKELDKKAREWDERRAKHVANRAELWDAKTTRRLDLSATPFAYHASIDAAEGFLFEYGPRSTSGAYNTPDAQQAFMIEHFGYRMRTGKLNKPDKNVDQGLMERQFNRWLNQSGALSGRMLDVDQDYSRDFVAVDSLVGNKIDEGMEYIRNRAWNKDDPLHEGYRQLQYKIEDQFDYHQRIRMLEAIKAPFAVERAKQHIALGRKVVIFHSRIKGGSRHPFRFEPIGAAPGEVLGDLTKAYNLAVADLRGNRNDLYELDLGNLVAPLDLFKQAFGERVTFYNGTIKKAEKIAKPTDFVRDDGPYDVIVVQDDAGKEGISLHDTTGKHPRALINIGLPVKPTQAIQIEGRTYRVGQQSDAIFEYFNTGTSFERWTFAQKIAERASTAENLAMGDLARRIRDAFVDAFENPSESAPEIGQGKGGKARDRASHEAMTPFQEAKTHYFANQKNTKRRDNREGVDYFATPEPLGLKMVEWAGLRPNESALEPSAGHGAIARYFPENVRATFVEPSGDLISRLALRASGTLRQQTFETLDEGANKYDAIVMNPPYGSAGATARDHLAKAMNHLKNGGRIVALLPDGPSANKKVEELLYGKDGEYIPELKEKLKKATGEKASELRRRIHQIQNFHVRAEIALPSVTFERAGTGVRTRVLVIDRIDAPYDGNVTQRSRNEIDVETIGELFDRIEEMGVPDRLTDLVSPEEVLTNFGLKLAEIDGAYDLAGNTFQNKDVIAPVMRKHGGNWNASGRYWTAKTDPSADLARALQGLPVEGLEAEPVAAAPTSNNPDIVEHTTQKGKVIRGVVRTDMTLAQAKEIDPYTFFHAKLKGWFIREKYLEKDSRARGWGENVNDVSFMVSDAAEVQQPKSEGIQELRGEGNSGMPAVGSKFSAISGRRRGEAEQRSLDRSHRRESELYAGQRAVGDDSRAGKEQVDKRVSGARRGNSDAIRLGEPDRIDAAEPWVSDKSRMDDKRGIDDAGAERGFDPRRENIDSERRDFDGNEMGSAPGVEQGNTPGQNQKRMVGQGGTDNAAKKEGRTETPNPANLTPSDIRASIAPMVASWKTAVKVEVLPSVTDPATPEAVRTAHAKLGENDVVDGVYYRGTVYLFSDAIRSEAHAAEVLMHEALGHLGLRGAFGPALTGVLDNLIAARRSDVIAKAKAYGLDPKDRNQLRQAAEEVLAELAQSRPEIGFVKRAVAAIRQWLRENIPAFRDLMLTDAEIIARYIAPARAFVERGGSRATDPDIRFSRRTPPVADPLLDEARRKSGRPAREPYGARMRRVLEQSFVTSKAERDAAIDAGRQGMLDQFHGIKRAEQRNLGNLPTEQSAYVTARLANGISSVMRAVLLHGAPQWSANGQHLVKKPGTQGLLDILAPVADDLDSWLDWMIGNRAKRLMGEGRENLFTEDEINRLIASGDGKEAQFRAVAKEFAAFKRSVLDVAEDAGLIDPESRATWDHADWIPFYRQMEATGQTLAPRSQRALANQSSGIRQLKGGTSALNDPIENIILNFHHLLDASLKNNAVRKSVKAAGEGVVERVGMEFKKRPVPRNEIRRELIAQGMPKDIVATFPSEVFDGISRMWSMQPPTDKDVIRVMEGGKPAYYRVLDPLLLKAVTSYEAYAWADVPGMAAARAAKRILTQAVTATPEFMLRNFIRDTASTAIISKSPVAAAGAIKGIVKAYRESGGAEHMLFAGASFASGYIEGGDTEAVARSVRRSLRRRGMSASSADAFMASVIDTPAKFWEQYRRAGEAIENANREAVFEAVIKRGGSVTEAAYEAKDLMDFSLRGGWAGYNLLADVIPFFNARVQGLYRLGRTDPKALAVRSAIMLTLPTLLLAFANLDNDEYEELADWDKDTYWHLFPGGEHYRVPKPFEVGLIFGTIPERAFHALAGDDEGKKFVQRATWGLVETFNLGFMPQLVGPLYEVATNRDAFRGTDIENMGDKNLLPHLRHGGRTSPTLRELLSVTAPVTDPLGLSPKRAQHLIEGYLGTMGAWGLGIVDAGTRLAIDEPDRPAMRPDDMPLLRVLYRGPQDIAPRSTQFINDVYDAAREYLQIDRSIKDLRKDGKNEAALRLEERFRERLDLNRSMAKAAETLTKQSKEIDAVYQDRRLTPEQKRADIDRLYRDRADIARDEVERRRAMKAGRGDWGD